MKKDDGGMTASGAFRSRDAVDACAANHRHERGSEVPEPLTGH